MSTFQICKNKLFNTYPAILHCPNNTPDLLWFDLIKSVKKHKPKVNLPKNVTIITFNSTDSKMVLEETLDLQGIPYKLLGKGIKRWTNPHKIMLLKDHLGDVDTEFVLVLDANDVIIIRSLHDLIDKFRRFECQMLYNASSFIYPCETFYSSKEEKITNNFFSHLNSGCFVGYTKFVHEVYRQAYEFEDDITRTHYHSDQIKIKSMYIKMYPKIKLDTHCNIFQIFHAKIPLCGFIEMCYCNNIALL